MRICRLSIEHFRCIENAVLHFDGHTLFVGRNNVGKSTICEALELVLGPDRLNGRPQAVGEFDFYDAKYLSDDGQTAIPARIEVVLTDLTREVELACATHLEFWHVAELRILSEGEIDVAAPPKVVRCLRLETVARYEVDEDEFDANTFFCHGTSNSDDTPEQVRRNVKRLFGFLYLRALRTGSRALSLERGSLLDIILRMQGVRTGLWERSLKRLRELDPPIASDAAELMPVLEAIEKRLAQYIPLSSQGMATRLFVSRLTREHLRETIAFFLTTSVDQQPVPFREVGTGTLSALVLALLSFIAEAKKDNVIFAMEEPEFALPPHTQRRIARYLLSETTQCFVTSHSPYVIEQFGPEQVHILKRSNDANVFATPVSPGAIKPTVYKRHARRGLAEAMLGTAVIVVEGISDDAAIRCVAEKMQLTGDGYYPLDLSGVTIFSVDGDGSLSMFGEFFKSIGMKAYAFYDRKQRDPQEIQKLAESFDVLNETRYVGIEKLLVDEVPPDRLWQFLEHVRESGKQGNLKIPTERPPDERLKTIAQEALRSNKGTGYTAILVDMCEFGELPNSITAFLSKVFSDFPTTRTPSKIDPASPLPSDNAAGNSVKSADE